MQRGAAAAFASHKQRKSKPNGQQIGAVAVAVSVAAAAASTSCLVPPAASSCHMWQQRTICVTHVGQMQSECPKSLC